MGIYAVVENGVVTNSIVWDGDTSKWEPPQSMTLVESTEATGYPNIGYTWNGTVFGAPAD
jgi:hypothetical protein